MKRTKKVYLKTFGCQMNKADSERMLALLEQDHYVPTSCAEEADLIIVNTCSVREKAYHKAISEIGKHNRSGPYVIMGITGCVASQEGRALAERFDSVDFVLGQTTSIRSVRQPATDAGVRAPLSPRILMISVIIIFRKQSSRNREKM